MNLGPLPAALVVAISMGATSVAAAPADDEWKFGTTVYLWGAGMDITLPNGQDVEIEFSDIVDNLDFAFMATPFAERGPWAVSSDFVYMDLSDNVDKQLLPAVELRSIGLEAWIVNPKVGYRVMNTEKSKIHLTLGGRYLWVEVDQKTNFSAPLPPGQVTSNESNSVWDATVGIIGQWEINDRWYAAYALDGGAGDSDSTWQAFAAVGYRFDRFDAMFGYRVIEWEFGGDVEALDELEVSGLIAGLKFNF